MPVAVTVNFAVDPSFTVLLVGCAVITGFVTTVRLAASVYTVPAAFIRRQRNSKPSRAAVAGTLSVAVPLPSEPLTYQLPVGLLRYCHW